MLRAVIWGAGGHGKVVADIIRQQALYEIEGFLEDPCKRSGQEHFGAKIIGGYDVLSALSEKGIVNAIVAVGPCKARMEIAQRLKESGFTLISAVHPKAIVAPDVELGPGCVVAAGAIIAPGSAIGSNVIINTGASVDHDCTLYDGVHICPGTRLAGNVTVGTGSWIGIGSTVIEKIEIGSYTFVGAATLVNKNLPDKVLAYGSPVRMIRRIEGAD